MPSRSAAAVRRANVIIGRRDADGGRRSRSTSASGRRTYSGVSACGGPDRPARASARRSPTGTGQRRRSAATTVPAGPIACSRPRHRGHEPAPRSGRRGASGERRRPACPPTAPRSHRAARRGAAARDARTPPRRRRRATRRARRRAAAPAGCPVEEPPRHRRQRRDAGRRPSQRQGEPLDGGQSDAQPGERPGPGGDGEQVDGAEGVSAGLGEHRGEVGRQTLGV